MVKPSGEGFFWGGLTGVIIALPCIALGAVVAAGALATVAVGAVIGGAAGALGNADITYEKIVSEVWTEKTEKFKYSARDGHEI